MMRFSAVARRAGWNLVDQVVSSLTNAGLSFVVARSVDETTFGGFAVVFTIFAVLVGLSRAAVTSPLPVRFSGAAPEDFEHASASALGAAFALGGVGGIGCIIAGWLVGGVAGHAVIALGVVLPGLLVQEAWRQAFIAAGRPAAAALNTTVWSVLQFSAVGGLLILGLDTVGPLVLAWGGAAAGAAVLGIRQSRTLPRPSRTPAWLRRHRDLTGYVIAEFATQQGAMQAALLVTAAVGTLTAIGALRGVQILLGVTTIVAVAAFSFALPEFSRRRDQMSRRSWTTAALVLSIVVSGLGFVWGLLWMLIPASVGQELLGETWVGVSAILFAAVIGQVANAFAMGPATMLRAMDRAPVTFRLNAVQAPLVFGGGVGGVLLDGAAGATWGFALAYWLMAPTWWIALHREAARLTAGAGPPQPTVTDRR